MTVSISAAEVAKDLAERFPGAVTEVTDQAIVVESEFLPEIAQYLRDSPELSFNYVNYITAVDYLDCFEVVYQLTSFQHNHTLVIKTRCYTREQPTVPSVVGVWRAADYQEREIFDLMGIIFQGHPNLKRIALWDGFQGHPLRKDYIS